jgi:hypothetical protein
MKSKLEELEATIKQAQAQIEELKNPKPKQWEPCDDFQHRSCPELLTQVRLLAYVDEFGGDWEADWSNFAQQKYLLRYDNMASTWGYGIAQYFCTAGAVYMSEECVQDLVGKLESQEVVL